MNGIEQQASRSLTSVHHIPSPRPSVELRRVRHSNSESDTEEATGVRADDQAVSPKARRWLEVQYACLCLALFLAGWNDGTIGPLIPRIQRYYDVGFAVLFIFHFMFLPIRAQVSFTLVSLIFIVNCVVGIRNEKKNSFKPFHRGSLLERSQTSFSRTKWDSAR